MDSSMKRFCVDGSRLVPHYMSSLNWKSDVSVGMIEVHFGASQILYK